MHHKPAQEPYCYKQQAERRTKQLRGTAKPLRVNDRIAVPLLISLLPQAGVSKKQLFFYVCRQASP